MTTKTVSKQVLGMTAPKDASDSQYYDKNCPFTGGLAVKKELIKGIVVKKDLSKSATIEWNKPFYIPKYERYEMRRFRLRVHNPPVIDAQVGQEVLVAKTRPLSKTKHHVIIAILDEEKKKTLSATEEDFLKEESPVQEANIEKTEEPAGEGSNESD